MIITIASLIAVAAIVFVLGVRDRDLPAPEPVSPFQYLDEKKAAIYDNLRDLQFEYRLGKLSDADYQATKVGLQRELAGVMAEVDRLKAQLGVAAPPPMAVAAPPKPKTRPGYVCPYCQAEFKENLKFCGECGKPMKAARA